MAGAGYKLFNTGDVLTAAQVNTYLQEQTVMVFANSAARTSALSGVLSEGMMSYLQDTNAVEVYNGSAWVGVSGAGDVTEVQAGTGISVASGTGPIPVVTNTMATEITAAGDIVVGTGSGTFDNLPIGTTGQVLTADTTVSPYKVKWAAAGGATFAGCSLKKTVSTQTINNVTWTAITWDGENYDTDGYHSTSTNTSRITIPAGKAGKYLIVAGAMITANNSGARLMKFEKNGAGVYYGNWMPATPTHTSVIVGSQVLDLAVNDYVEVFIYQDSGGSLDINGNNSDSTLTATYLGA